ncbi:MAG: protein translocase subunit SecF [Elusimicrobia bacterium]|nr:protein translocase subunit SecF [Elusimicrobiota bacterium]
MFVLLGKTQIDFVKRRYLFFAISGFFFALGAFSIAKKGLNPGMDFTGGTLLQVGFSKPVSIGTIREALSSSGIQKAEIQSFPEKNSFVIRIKGGQENVDTEAQKILKGLSQKMPDNLPKEERREYVGPTVGKHLGRQALLAMALSLLGIIVYVAFRFSNPLWGISGVVALLHDIFMTLTALSLTGREIDLVIIASLLSIAGYSINDTIVIFDRMRENMKLKAKLPLYDLINTSLNETLSRTLITNLTVFMAVLSLLFLGGENIHDFAFAMFWGSVSGTYSTIAIATPLVYEWETRRRPQLKMRETLDVKREMPKPKIQI